MNRPSALKSVLLVTAAVAAVGGLALSGCKPNTSANAPSSAPAPLAALPLSTGAAPPIAPGPSTGALPPAPAAPIGQLADADDDYAFADRAYAMNEGFGDAPPDYTFDYGDGERPWVWRGDDRSMRIAEALPGGGYRYYYYEPGADAPYLIVDADDSYAFSDGQLVVVFDRHGRRLPPGARFAQVAGRLMLRARQINDAAQRQQHQAVAEANWVARRSQLAAERAQWAQDEAADAQWQAYHTAHAQQDQAYWAAERYRREAEAARFARQTNNQALAAHDWQAAQRAQATAAASQEHPGVFGAGQPQQPPSPPRTAQTAEPAPPPPQAQAQAAAAAARAAQEQQQAAQRAEALAHAQNQEAAQRAAEAQAAAQRQAAQQQALSQAAARRAAQQAQQAQAQQATAQAEGRGAAAAQAAAAQRQAAQQQALAQEAARRATQQAQQAQARQAAAQAEARRAAAAQAAAQHQTQAQQADAHRLSNANAQGAKTAPPPSVSPAAKPEGRHPGAAAPTNQTDRP